MGGLGTLLGLVTKGRQPPQCRCVMVAQVSQFIHRREKWLLTKFGWEGSGGCPHMAHDTSNLDLMGQVSPHWQPPGNSCRAHSWSAQRPSHLLFQRVVHRHVCPLGKHFTSLHTRKKQGLSIRTHPPHLPLTKMVPSSIYLKLFEDRQWFFPERLGF